MKSFEVGRTSTSELTCDAGTLGALSAGDLGRFCALAYLLSLCYHYGHRPRRSETCRIALCYPLSARSHSSFRLESRWFDDASRAPSNQAPAARSGRTAATRGG